jgi:hypothetical protein
MTSDPTGPGQAPRITTLGVPTRQRVPSLRRCLATYLECCRAHGRRLSIVVVDDAPDADGRRSCREMLRALPRVAEVEVLYAGPEEKVRYAEGLSRQAGVAPEVVAFALLNPERCPVTTGAGRNALLLHAAGELLLQADDDTTCRLAPVPGALPGLAVSAHPDPTEFWFIGEGEPLPAVGAPDEEDLFAVHECLLGNDMTPGAPVAVTATGVVGASGMGSPLYLLNLRGASRERLLRSGSGYRDAVAGGLVLRAVPQATLCEGAFCMTLNLGLDCRRLLPPFLPVQRNQDGVFAALMRVCAGAGRYGFLPRAVLHEPPQRPSGAARPWEDVDRPRTGQVVQLLIRAAAAQAAHGPVRRRLAAVGLALEELASRPPADFDALVRVLWHKQLRGLASQLANQLRQHAEKPAYWADDVRWLLTAWDKHLADGASVVPADLEAASGATVARDLMRRLAQHFGRLLQSWPLLVDAARDLRSRGMRLGVPI